VSNSDHSCRKVPYLSKLSIKLVRLRRHGEPFVIVIFFSDSSEPFVCFVERRNYPFSSMESLFPIPFRDRKEVSRFHMIGIKRSRIEGCIAVSPTAVTNELKVGGRWAATRRFQSDGGPLNQSPKLPTCISIDLKSSIHLFSLFIFLFHL
jgi:hypothetical protein